MTHREVKKVEKNFEITDNMRRNVQEYAQFFHITEKSMMSILFSMGENICKEMENFNFKETFIEKHRKNKYLEQDFELYKNGVMFEELLGNYKNEDAFVQRGERKESIAKSLKRRKLKITDEQCEKIKKIVKITCAKGEKICDSDVICYFISCGLNKLKYLQYKPDWGIKLCEDEEFKAPQEIYITIPNAFYMCIENRANNLNISVSDYIKIIIEEKFDEDREIMSKQIREQIDQRKRDQSI